jgi:hypothetical protein
MIGMRRSEGGVRRAKTGESAAGASSRMHAESALKKGVVGGCCKFCARTRAAPALRFGGGSLRSRQSNEDEKKDEERWQS